MRPNVDANYSQKLSKCFSMNSQQKSRLKADFFVWCSFASIFCFFANRLMRMTIIPLTGQKWWHLKENKHGHSAYYISVVHICAAITAAIPIWMSRATRTTLVWRCDICDFLQILLQAETRCSDPQHAVSSIVEQKMVDQVRVQSFTTCSSNFSNANKLIFTMMPRYDLITYLSSYGWRHKQWRVNMQSVLSMNFDLYNTITWPKFFSVLPSDCYCVRFQNALLNKNIGLEEKNLREYLEKVKMSSKPYILSSCLKIVLDRTWHRWSKVIKHQV